MSAISVKCCMQAASIPLPPLPTSCSPWPPRCAYKILLHMLCFAFFCVSRGNAQAARLHEASGEWSSVGPLVCGGFPPVAHTHTFLALRSVADQLVQIKFCGVTLTHSSWLAGLIDFHRPWSHAHSYQFIGICKIWPLCRPVPRAAQTMFLFQLYNLVHWEHLPSNLFIFHLGQILF